MNAGSAIHVAPAVFFSGSARSRYDGPVDPMNPMNPVKQEGAFFVLINMSS